MNGMDLLRRPVPLLALIALACFAAVGAALISQYRFDMQPCPWCTLQRLIFLIVGSFALLGVLIPSNGVRRVLAFGGLLFALAGAGRALWQHLVAAKSDSCALTLADRIQAALGHRGAPFENRRADVLGAIADRRYAESYVKR